MKHYGSSNKRIRKKKAKEVARKWRYYWDVTFPHKTLKLMQLHNKLMRKYRGKYGK